MSILRINQNIIAMNANRHLRTVGSSIAKSLERLSSGLRINRAADDAAGLSISENLRAQIRGLNRASQNALDGISLIQTAEGALNETSSILQRIRELAVQSANGALTANDRIGIQAEVDQLIDEIDRIASSTEFNAKKLLDGTLGALISTDDPTQLRAAVVGNVGKGGNFTIQLNTVDAGRLQVQKTDVFATIQGMDAVGKVNYLDTITLDATFTPVGGQSYGNTGVFQISPTPNAAGALAVANGTATLTVSDLVDAGNGVGTNRTLSQLLQSYEITTNVDTVVFSFTDLSGTIRTATLTLDANWTLSTFATQLAAAASTASGGAVNAAVANGVISLGGNFVASGYQMMTFNDVDGSGSAFLISFANGRSNQFFSSITGTIQNLGGSATFNLSGGQVRTIGNATTTGTFDIRFDNVGTRDLVSVSFQIPSGGSYGASGLDVVQAFADAKGSVAAANGSMTFSLVSLYSASGTSSISTLINANGLTNGDAITLTYTDNAGSTLTAQMTLTVTMTLDDIANGLMSLVVSTVGAATVSFAVNTDGEISFGGAYFNSTAAAFVGIAFNDTDATGSEFWVTLASLSGSGSIAVSNLFFSAAQYRVTTTSGTITSLINGGGMLYSIGNTTAGGFYGRLDVMTYTGNVGQVDNLTFSRLGVVGQSDAIATSYNTGGNDFQAGQNVRQVSAPSYNGTIYMSAISNRTFALYRFDNQAYSNIFAAGGSRTAAIAAAISGNRISGAGGANVFSIGATVNFGGSAIADLQGIEIAFNRFLTAGETATFNVSTNNVLTADQQNTLASINRFQDFGVFNGRSSLQFTVYIKGQGGATVNVSSNDTLEDLAGKISLAIANPNSSTDLNAESTIDFFQPPDLVHVNTVGLAKGTISITTPIPGLQLVFSGDESFLNAMSLIEIQGAAAPVYSVTARNVETGALIATQRSNTGKISGLLPGLDILLDTAGGIKLDPDPPIGNVNATTSNSPYFLATERPVVSVSSVAKQLFLHVAPRDFILQIGSNQGQRIRSFIGDLSSEALGVKGLLVVTEDLAQEAITITDQAIARVSSERGRLGAIQNRLESTIRNLDVAAENLISSESRIRDVDVASETLASTRNQILLQAAIAALAQANQLPQAVLQLLR